MTHGNYHEVMDHKLLVNDLALGQVYGKQVLGYYLLSK